MADLLGDALVPGAVQVDLAGRADHHTDRPERSGARDPQLRRSGHVSDVGLAAEHQDVEVVGRHLGQRPFAAAAAQSLSGRAGSRVPSGPPVGCVGVVGDATGAVLGDDHDLLASISAGAVLPDRPVRAPAPFPPGRRSCRRTPRPDRFRSSAFRRRWCRCRGRGRSAAATASCPPLAAIAARARSPEVAPALVTASTASMISRHFSNCACCRSDGSSPTSQVRPKSEQ